MREAFQRFFEERGHRRLPGAPIVPPGDPTLLFTSAGMVQFKPYFMGQAKAPAARLTTVQKCFRTTDIEEVGDTSHMTFFEMLGNFSVGDYFKAEVIPWAWEFVTQHLKLEPERIWVSIYLDDDEAFEIWRQTGVPGERIVRYGDEDNYWFSGDIGPCGPCSEIYYDFGPQFGCEACEPRHSCGRFLEIWNLVFMSFYCDGESRTPLPSRNIDTGSGVERVLTVLKYNEPDWDKDRLPSAYDTDVFRPVITRLEELSGKRYGDDAHTDRAMRIVAEHARAVTFLIGDERTPVAPSNEERGYVVRRMLRRAIYFARRDLNIEKPLMHDMADVVIRTMAPSYPELERQREFVLDILGPEERRFDETLSRELDRQLIRSHEQVSTLIERWAEAIRRVLSDREPEDWPGFIEEANERAYGNLIGLTMLTGTLGPQGIPWEKVPDWLVGQTLDPLIHNFRQATTELNSALTNEFNRALHELGARKRGDKRTAALVGNRLRVYQSQIESLVAKFTGLASQVASSLTGAEAFVLHDTYGFPIELTREIAAQNGFTVDEAGFQAEMERQRERARAHAGGAGEVAADALYTSLVSEATAFLGYDTLEARITVAALVHDGSSADAAEAPAEVEVFLTGTPFYPEGGGQVGDRGEITGPNGRMTVEDTHRVAERLIVHRGRVAEGRIAVGDEVTARVDPEYRSDTMRNHTATHLLHAALRQVLGSHVRQAGSLVAPDHLRFDFTYTEAVKPEQLAEVEALVNEKVRQNVPVHTRVTTFDEAMSEGALAFFGDKYGEEVRLVEVNTVVPRFSAELCGGTHCHHTGEIGIVIVTGESSIGSGMRRIEALTGRGAEDYVRKQRQVTEELARTLSSPKDAILAKASALQAEADALRRRVEKLERSLATAPTSGRLMDAAVDVEGVRVLATKVDAPSTDALRYLSDAVRKDLPSGVAVLASVIDERPQFIAIVSKDLIPRGLHAGNILKRVTSIAGGGGGGRPDMAQGGGKDPSKVDAALAVVPAVVKEMLASTAG